MARPAWRIDDSGGPHGHRLHPSLASAPYIDAHQHLPRQRFLHKAPKAAHVVFRYEAHGRPHAAYKRPLKGAEFPDGAGFGSGLHFS